ncbi:MAG: glycosyltransferase family 4 protein [Deltaproteobacteria bacterium]|nr:glycosyltransferase family 4 protein [Candidatus Zymogenaceae bacterium]
MKILLVTSSFPRWPGDWAGVFVLSLGRRLTMRGHEVTVLCPHAQGLPVRDVMDGVRVERFRYAWPQSVQTLAYGEGMLHNVRRHPLRLLLVAPYVLALGMRMRSLRTKHDVINAHFLIPQGITARVFGVRAVVSLHGSDVNLDLGPMGRRLMRFGLFRAPAVTANSRATAARTVGLVPGDRVKIIPMGVDAAAFGTAGKRSRTFGEGGCLRLICVGRLIRLKGQQYLIEALPAIRERFPQASLTLVGDGPDRDALAHLVQELGLADAVRFTGEIPHERIDGLLAEHDIFVLPSIVVESGETEGLGTVLLEAMAAGVPVIGSAVGGIPDIITDGENGLLAPQRSPNAIARAVLNIALDADLRERLATSARRDVRRRFSWEAIAEKFEELFNDVIGV